MIVYLNKIRTLMTGFSDVHCRSACDVILVLTSYDYIPTSSCRICYCENSNPKALSMIFYLVRYSSLKFLIRMIDSFLLRIVISTDDYQYQNINRLVESFSSHGASN